MSQQKREQGDLFKGVNNSQKVSGHAVLAILHVSWFLLTLGFTLVFGFIRDWPGQVATINAKIARGEKVDKDKKILALFAVWLSAGFHACVSFVLLSGLIVTAALPLYITVLAGFAHLPLAVQVAARRRSAFGHAPYKLKTLTGHVAEVLESMGQRVEIFAQSLLAALVKRRRQAASTPEQHEAVGNAEARNAKILKFVVLWGPMVLTALLSILAIFKLPVGGFIFWAGGITWAMWMYIAWAAAGKNMAIESDNAAIRSWTIAILRQLCNGTAAEWEDARVDVEDGCRVATNVPLSAVLLRAGDADSILAQIAPQWELGECTPEAIVLQPVSDATLERRNESTRSGGLIGGPVDWTTDTIEEAVPATTAAVAPEDLFS